MAIAIPPTLAEAVTLSAPAGKTNDAMMSHKPSTQLIQLNDFTVSTPP